MTTVLASKTTLAKNNEQAQRWFIVDADGLVLGRLASMLATILMGKHKPIYTAHVDIGDFIVVTNAEKIKMTGNKLAYKTYDYYTYYPGGHKVVPYEKLMEKHPERIIELAVRRMLPKSRLGRHMLTKLKIFRSSDHTHQAQQPTELDLSKGLAAALKELTV